MSTLNVESISHPTPGSLATINGTAPSNRNQPDHQRCDAGGSTGDE
jgi:hypothetical protein